MSQELTGKIAFASGKTGDYDIWTLELETGVIRQITDGMHWNDKPKWSPDGEWIVFVSDRTGSPEIYKAPGKGGAAIQLTNIGRWADSPSFSPDGRQIAFVSNEAGNNDIWIMDSDGGNAAQITKYEGSDDYVEWTADGRGLLWSSDRDDRPDGDSDLWHIELASGEKTQLNDDLGADFAPAASPDGSLIAFCSTRQLTPNPNKPFEDRDKDIWLMRTDGSWPVRLTENQAADFSPAWSPDGRYILYSSSHGRKACHLRVMDVSELATAAVAGDQQLFEKLADSIRTAKVDMDREDLKNEIGARRNSTFVTALLPESWVASCYPAQYFGLERNPHWAPTTAEARVRPAAGLGAGATA